MPRNIMLLEQQQNSEKNPHISKQQKEKKNSFSSTFSDEDNTMEEKWRTNLFISESQARVQKRDQGYRKNTSFQNKIINDHIKVMIQCVCQMQESHLLDEIKKVCKIVSQQQSRVSGMNRQLVQKLVEENTYLTEDEKSEAVDLFTQNYDNYQILLKTISRLQRLQLLKQQHSFILIKIVKFITDNYQLKLRKYDQEFMQKQIPKRLLDVLQQITNHTNIKLINPQYFYNTNEKVYMKIIQNWFYSIFAIKLGIYTNKYSKNSPSEMDLE